MVRATSSPGPFSRAYEAVAGVGVDRRTFSGEVKNVRFCNLASASVTLVALLFALAEAPLIVDLGVSGAHEWTLLVLRFLATAPFAAPLLLNARRRYRAARGVFVGWAILFVVGQTLLYGAAVPAHLNLLPTFAAAFAMFPREERRGLVASAFAAAAALAVCLWLRTIDEPLVPIRRPVILRVVDFVVTFGALGITGIVAMTQRRTTEDAEERSDRERDRAERLLLNILPAPIAERLKESPASIADAFDEVTVMFADLVGFTPLSEKLAPAELVALMDRVFTEFDRLAEAHGLEKIKTIGDAYMVAGGLPTPRLDHTESMAEMALEMLPIVAAMPAPTGQPLGIRIGIARGAAVAGVIGTRKFSYDLWGDTVNTASRLESHGAPGRIQVNEAVYERLRGRYVLEARGEVEIKGKGLMRTWYLVGRDPA